MTSPPLIDPAPFTVAMHARWPDIDQNGHMRTVAYLEWAEDSRMQFFASAGFPMTEFARLGIGPVILSDHLRYTAEMRLLEPGSIELTLAGMSEDGARFTMRNVITRADGRTAVTIVSDGRWLDLTSRRLCVPPDPLRAALATLARTSEDTTLDPLTTPV